MPVHTPYATSWISFQHEFGFQIARPVYYSRLGLSCLNQVRFSHLAPVHYSQICRIALPLVRIIAEFHPREAGVGGEMSLSLCFENRFRHAPPVGAGEGVLR